MSNKSSLDKKKRRNRVMTAKIANDVLKLYKNQKRQ